MPVPKCLGQLLKMSFGLSDSSRGVWDPERWHLDRKRSETPPDDERGVRGDLPMDHKVLIINDTGSHKF